MIVKSLIFLMITSFATVPAIAAPACEVAKLLDLPVQIVDRRAIVTAVMGNKEARFILDTGAFYSTMSSAAAIEYGLKFVTETHQETGHLPVPSEVSINGVNGQVAAKIGVVDKIVFGGIVIPRVPFLVGGSDVGQVGLLGQNFLGLFDVEYDFQHSMVRFLQLKNCGGVDAAYWAGDRPIATVRLRSNDNRHYTDQIAGTVTLNGIKLQAIFDSGAPESRLTLDAARSTGVTPQSPGVTDAGYATGVGSKAIKDWVGPFANLDLGGELIPKPRLHFSDINLNGDQMLIGFDFFLSHRILIQKSAKQMLLTYEGGAVFGLKPKGAVDASGKAIDLTQARDQGPTDAAGFARRGSVLLSTGETAQAIADFDKAVTLAPANPDYLRLRAKARMADHQWAAALVDLDKVVASSPSDLDARLLRARVRIEKDDSPDAREDLHFAEKLLLPVSSRWQDIAELLVEAGDAAAALPDLDLWLKNHKGDAGLSDVLNERCWARALLNRELDKALTDCNAALRVRPGEPAFLDSRALVYARRGDLSAARADYDAVLAQAPQSALSRYARSLIRLKMGDAAGSDSDRAAALAEDPRVAKRAKRLGVE